MYHGKDNSKSTGITMIRADKSINSIKRTYNELVYTDEQRRIVCLGRGENSQYGNIDDLDPNKYDSEQMCRVSWERQ